MVGIVKRGVVKRVVRQVVGRTRLGLRRLARARYAKNKNVVRAEKLRHEGVAWNVALDSLEANVGGSIRAVNTAESRRAMAMQISQARLLEQKALKSQPRRTLRWLSRSMRARKRLRAKKAAQTKKF